MSEERINIAILTKNIFFSKDHILISNRFLFDEEVGIYGFKANEIKKLCLIGFISNEKFEGYVYNLNEIEKILVVGPKYSSEEKSYYFGRIRNIFGILKELWKNRRLLNDIQILASPFFEYSPFIYAFFKFFSNVKIVNYIIGDNPEWNYRKRKSIVLKIFLLLLLKLSMKLANENWFLSKYLLNKYSKYKKKDILIYSSSVKKKEIGEPKKIDIQGEIVLLFVGRLEKEKRPEVALLTFKKLRELGYKCSLKIVGDGSLRKQLEELAKSLEIKNCTFLGWIKDRSALMDIYNGSHILLLPSVKGEGLGFVLLEAMAKGLVIIATDCGGPKEIIDDGINGFIVNDLEDKDVINAFVERVEFLIKNPEIYAKMSKNNIEKIGEWTIEKFCQLQRERILNLIQRRKN